jgi:hypothetical protein
VALISTKTIDGLTYEAVPDYEKGGCTGCVGDSDGSLCVSLGNGCGATGIIWQKANPVTAGLNGTTASDIKDSINPSHYKIGGIETIDYLKAKLTPEEFNGYLKGNALKYLSRSNHKHDDPVEDYKKARWYINKLVSTLEVQET